jgi:hypothetical protein
VLELEIRDREVPELEIRKRPSSTLSNIDGGPLASADEDPGAPTINIKIIGGGPTRWC